MPFLLIILGFKKKVGLFPKFLKKFNLLFLIISKALNFNFSKAGGWMFGSKGP